MDELLKTLDDITHQRRIYLNGPIISEVIDIKKEAIKWYKNNKKYNEKFCDMGSRGAMIFIKLFFNITEEDLKNGWKLWIIKIVFR